MSSCLGENTLLACAHVRAHTTTVVNVATWDRQQELCHFSLDTQCRWSDCEIDSQTVKLIHVNKVVICNGSTKYTTKQHCKLLWSKRVFMNKKWNTVFKNTLLVSKNHLRCVLRYIRRKCNSCLETGGWRYETFQRNQVSGTDRMGKAGSKFWVHPCKFCDNASVTVVSLRDK